MVNRGLGTLSAEQPKVITDNKFTNFSHKDLILAQSKIP